MVACYVELETREAELQARNKDMADLEAMLESHQCAAAVDPGGWNSMSSAERVRKIVINIDACLAYTC